MRRRGQNALKLKDAGYHLVGILKFPRMIETRLRKLYGLDVFRGRVQCRRLDRIASEHLANGEHIHDADAFELQKRLQRRGERVIALASDERSASVKHLDKPERLERPDGFAHRRLADPEPVGQLLFGREPRPVRQPAGDDILAQGLDDLVDDLDASTARPLRLQRRSRCRRCRSVHVT